MPQYAEPVFRRTNNNRNVLTKQHDQQLNKHPEEHNVQSFKKTEDIILEPDASTTDTIVTSTSLTVASNGSQKARISQRFNVKTNHDIDTSSNSSECTDNGKSSSIMTRGRSLQGSEATSRPLPAKSVPGRGYEKMTISSRQRSISRTRNDSKTFIDSSLESAEKNFDQTNNNINKVNNLTESIIVSNAAETYKSQKLTSIKRSRSINVLRKYGDAMWSMLDSKSQIRTTSPVPVMKTLNQRRRMSCDTDETPESEDKHKRFTMLS